MVSKKLKLLLFFLVLSLNFIPVYDSLGETSVPLEISIIDLEYPHSWVNVGSTSTGYTFDLTYNIKNPSNQSVGIFMPSCYGDLPFAHINATFSDENLTISYGYIFLGMSCGWGCDASVNENRNSKVHFYVSNHTEERLPIGFYTIWLDLNYSFVYYPTVVSYAYMNVTEDSVDIEYDWIGSNETSSETSKTTSGLEISYIIVPFVSLCAILWKKRK